MKKDSRKHKLLLLINARIKYKRGEIGLLALGNYYTSVTKIIF